MERSRVMRCSAPLVLVIIAAAAASAPNHGAAVARAAGPRACAEPGVVRQAIAGPAWYWLDPILDTAGSLRGQRLVVGRGGARWTADLAAESFASGPIGGRVLVGDDDGTRSRLRLLDAARGCWTFVGEERSVIRSAVMAPGGTAVYEHRVDRATRGDLGVWRRNLRPGSGSGAAIVLPGLGSDAAHGRTFTTSLQVGADGRLVVASCGERRCRTRVVATDGRVAEVTGTGPALGATGDRLVTLQPCEGLPCGLDAHDLRSGGVTRMGEASGVAVVAGSGAIVTSSPSGVTLIEPGGARRALAGTSGLVPIAADSTSTRGVEAPGALVPLVPRDRLEPPAGARLLDPATATTTALEAVP